MEKEVYVKGNYYKYENIDAYCYCNNRLVLSDGRIVLSKKSKYIPDEIGYGSLCNKGYRRVRCEGKNIFVHRLVAIHFVDNPNNFSVVDHINENREDNRAENLQWLTLEANSARTNVREHKSLDQAKATLKEAKDVLEFTKKLEIDLIKEKEELDREYKKLEHKKKIFIKEIEDKSSSYEAKVKELLKVCNMEMRRQEEAKLKTVKNMVNTRKKYLQSISKTIYINGNKYDSIRSASRYIVGEERRNKGNLLNLETVRKELRRIQLGTRREGVMYNSYDVTKEQK